MDFLARAATAEVKRRSMPDHPASILGDDSAIESSAGAVLPEHEAARQ